MKRGIETSNPKAAGWIDLLPAEARDQQPKRALPRFSGEVAMKRLLEELHDARPDVGHRFVQPVNQDVNRTHVGQGRHPGHSLN